MGMKGTSFIHVRQGTSQQEVEAGHRTEEAGIGQHRMLFSFFFQHCCTLLCSVL